MGPMVEKLDAVLAVGRDKAVAVAARTVSTFCFKNVANSSADNEEHLTAIERFDECKMESNVCQLFGTVSIIGSQCLSIRMTFLLIELTHSLQL